MKKGEVNKGIKRHISVSFFPELTQTVYS